MGLISNTVFISIYIHTYRLYIHVYIDGLVQERSNSIANALELRLSCTNPSIYYPCLSICLSDKHSQSHPSVLRATHPALHEFTATLSDSSILLSFPPYIHPFFFLPGFQPASHEPTHPLSSRALPPSSPSIHSSIFLSVHISTLSSRLSSWVPASQPWTHPSIK